MKLPGSALWLAGFRPFFGLAMLAGLSLPVLWVLLYSGWLAAPASPYSILQWHAHEMFFGFGWAVLGGFLLTSSKNWVKVRGYHGGSLLFLAAAWLFERAGMWFGGAWPTLLLLLSNNLFLVAIIAMLMWTLIRHRRHDAYRDNYFSLGTGVVRPCRVGGRHRPGTACKNGILSVSVFEKTQLSQAFAGTTQLSEQTSLSNQLNLRCF